MSDVSERIGNSSALEKLTDPDTVVMKLMPKVKTLAFGGMGGQSVPKAFTNSLARLSGKMDFNNLTLFTGGGGTEGFEKAISSLNIVRRYYYLSGESFRKKVNSGSVKLFDYWVSEYSRNLREGYFSRYGPIDLAVIEISEIDADGHIIPSLSVDSSTALIQASKKVVLEINTRKPALRGLHDIYSPRINTIIPIVKVMDRIGKEWIDIPHSKISGIVFSDENEEPSGSYDSTDSTYLLVGKNVADFLRDNVYQNAKFKNRPLQLGAGSIANAILTSLNLSKLSIWSEIIPSGWISKIGQEVAEISASAIYSMTGDNQKLSTVYEEILSNKDKIVLRPNEVTNSVEVISRLGVVVVQPAIEIDIYGSVNVSHIRGNLRNGVGGSGDFTRAGSLTIIALPSTASKGMYSRVVPMLTNVDIPKQDVDVVITDQGVADLRGLSPRERAIEIISKCSHPSYTDYLGKYLKKAVANGGNVPIDTKSAFLDP